MKLFDMQSNIERLQMKFLRPLFIHLSFQESLIGCSYCKLLFRGQMIKLQLNKDPKFAIISKIG